MTFTIEGRQAARAKTIELREKFEKEFGHKYDSGGFKGHPFFGYNCRDCGIHIGMVTGTGWAKHKGVWPRKVKNA